MSPDLTAIISQSVDNTPLLLQLEAAYFGLQPSDKTHITALLNQAQHLAGDHAKAFVLAALSWCQRLYNAGRSAEAVPLARVCTGLADELADAPLQHRAATAYGNVLTDAGAMPAAIQQHVRALKLAEKMGDANRLATGWLNIGNLFYYAGANLLAVEAYKRGRRLLPRCTDPYVAYKTYTNLAICHLHFGEIKPGLSAAGKAMSVETATIIEMGPLYAILLRRVCSRLLVLAGRAHEAAPLIAEISHIVESHPTPRSRIAHLLAQGSYEAATGQYDTGITRLCEALALARQHPPALSDALTALYQTEEQAGHPDLAAYYLAQLSDLVRKESIATAYQQMAFPALYDHAGEEAVSYIEAASERLRPAAPLGEPLQHLEWLAITTAYRLEKTGGHAERVGNLTHLLALEAGYSPMQAAEIGYAARFHDIGLIAVPQTLLTQAASLNMAEQQTVRAHTVAGANLLASHNSATARLAQDIARYHHERWDGQGYPNGIAGLAIPRPARLCAIADTFDALRSPRPHRPALNYHAALEKLHTLSGAQLDPDLTACFITSAKEGAIHRHLTGLSGSRMPASQSLDETLANLLQRQ